MSTLALAAAAALRLAAAQGPGADVRDGGADRIDVSAYPAEQRARYELLRQKCSRCHSVARAVNSGFTPAEWKRYIKRMVRRPNTGISEDQADQIHEFLQFYSSRPGR